MRISDWSSDVCSSDLMADADHLIGALALTVISLAAAEVARALRFLLITLGAALLVTPFIYAADSVAKFASIACGLGLILHSIRPGTTAKRYAGWQKLDVCVEQQRPRMLNELKNEKAARRE